DYTDADGDIVVARYQVSATDPNRADAASGRVVLRVDKDFANHNGGNVLFGPDGYLYLSVGDGGAAGNLCRRAQTLSPKALLDGANPACKAHEQFVRSGGNPDSRALEGKLLRIDVDHQTPAGAHGLCGVGSADAAPYAIPADNPFAAS